MTQLVRIFARLLVDVFGVARHRRHGDLLRVVDDKGGENTAVVETKQTQTRVSVRVVWYC